MAVSFELRFQFEPSMFNFETPCFKVNPLLRQKSELGLEKYSQV